MRGPHHGSSYGPPELLYYDMNLKATKPGRTRTAPDGLVAFRKLATNGVRGDHCSGEVSTPKSLSATPDCRLFAEWIARPGDCRPLVSDNVLYHPPPGLASPRVQMCGLSQAFHWEFTSGWLRI